jgi:hypothetical protein
MTQASSLILNPSLVDEVRNSMMNTIQGALRRPDVETLKRVNEDLRVLEGVSEVWVADNWLVIPKVSMRGTRLPLWRLSGYFDRWLEPYIPDAPCVTWLLWERAFKYDRCCTYNVYAFDTTDRGNRVLLMRLAILGHLVRVLQEAYRKAFNNETTSSARARVVKQLCSGCEGLDTDGMLNCMTRNITNALKSLRGQLVNAVDRRVKWLERRVTLHNLIAGMIGKYVKSIQQVNSDGEFRDRERASRYLGVYMSYVEYDGEAVRYTPSWDLTTLIIPLLGGVEEGEKFVRIKLDLIGPVNLTLKSIGSWLIGLDKVTRQPFSISLPYQCTVMPINVCVEYALGIRDQWLRRVAGEPVEVTEA